MHSPCHMCMYVDAVAVHSCYFPLKMSLLHRHSYQSFISLSAFMLMSPSIFAAVAAFITCMCIDHMYLRCTLFFHRCELRRVRYMFIQCPIVDTFVYNVIPFQPFCLIALFTHAAHEWYRTKNHTFLFECLHIMPPHCRSYFSLECSIEFRHHT